MFARLTHAAIAFFVTAVAYQVYAVVVVPLVEPTHTDAGAADRRQAAADHNASALDKHREFLSAYFAPDHWSLETPPKTIESGHALIVLDDFAQSQDGKLRINRCVVIYFPGGRNRGGPPPRDAILLEAPQGAVLQMDDRPGAGPATLGRIQWGELRGAIHIYSDMHEPGPSDDLRLITSDLRLNENGLSTREAVEMKLGEHRGRGRGLEIRRLSTSSNDRGDGQSGVLRGLDVLEISSEVSVDLSATDLRLFGKRLARDPEPLALSGASGGQPIKTPRVEAGPAPPIRIKCTGPFRFDFANNKAAFLDNVTARQIQPDGQLNELLADELNLYLITTGRHAEVARGKPDRASPLAGQLEPGTLEAKGSPVRLDAPSYETSVTGERLRIQIPQRLITVDGGDEAVLRFREGEIHAPMVQYRMPGEGSQQKIGEMNAAGRGWLKAIVAKDRPHEPLEVTWSTSMRLSRETGPPILSVIGRPRLRMPGVGDLQADEMHVYLQENGPEGPAAVTPDRLVAKGAVSIDAPELSCRVNALTLWIAYQQAVAADGPGGDHSGGNPLDARRGLSGRRSYAVSGDTLALLVNVRDRRPDVARVDVAGNVVFQESAPQQTGPPPLRVVARQLRVEQADTPHAEITILGSPATGNQPAQNAEITVGGATIRAESLRLNRGESKAWIDAPGEVLLAVDQDLTGSPLEKPERLAITWRDSMRLEQDRITFTGSVLAKTASAHLQTPRLVARLSTPVQFDGGAATERPELTQIECYDGVRLRYDVLDDAGLTARQRAELRTLSVNLATGQIDGDGPGEIESVHLAAGSSPWAKFAGQKDAPSNDPPQRLRYLQTSFNRGISGNLHRRAIRLHGNVRTIYGPVDAWEQALHLAPGEEPPPHTVHLECETLGLAESPSARLFTPPGGSDGLGPLELTADGRVTIEGQTPEHGAFTARGARATYDQLKTMFVLEGRPNAPAKIWRQEYVGAPHTVGSAQKIQYWLNTGRASGKGFRWEIHEFR